MSPNSTAQRDTRKTVAAIMAAVNACLEDDEKARAASVSRPRPAVAPSLWPVFGREEMMRMRTLWQRRIARG
jgi:hypothetical protein